MVLALSLSGCVGSSGVSPEENQTRTYSAAINGAVEEINVQLNAFDEALKTDSTFSVKAAAGDLSRALDALADLQAPETMSEVQKGYTEGCQKLKAALDAMVDLYSSLENQGTSSNLTSQDLEARMGAIQEQYQAGIDDLAKADEQAHTILEASGANGASSNAGSSSSNS